MPDDDATKICPDCAETVLAAARRCRFCGYRFDQPQSLLAPSTARGLLKHIRRPATSMTTSVLLAQWSVPEGDDAVDGDVCYGTIDGSTGFIVVTSARFLFLRDASAVRARSIGEQRRLAELVAVRRRRRRIRTDLVIEWAGDRTVTVISHLAPRDLARLEAALAPHVDTGLSP